MATPDVVVLFTVPKASPGPLPDPSDSEAVYRFARLRVDKDRKKGVVPSSDNIESWLYSQLRDAIVEPVADRAVARLANEELVYIGNDRASYESVVADRGHISRHEHNNQKYAHDSRFRPIIEFA